MDKNENTERENEKLPVQTRLDPSLYSLISNLATGEERSISKMVELLLKESPRIQTILEQAAEASA